MLQILDTPITIDYPDRAPVTLTIRQLIVEYKIRNAHILLLDFLSEAIHLITEFDEYQITPFEAEIILYNVMQKEFGDELTKEIFKKAKSSREFYMSFDPDLFFNKYNGILIDQNDPESLENGLALIRGRVSNGEEFEDSPEFKNHQQIIDGTKPSLN